MSRFTLNFLFSIQPSTFNFTGVRALTFDAGGTLLYPHPGVGEIYSEVMRGHDLHIAPELLERGFRSAWKSAHSLPRVGVSEESEKNWWRNVVQTTLHGLSQPAEFEPLFEELWQTFAEPRRWQLFDGARETLLEFKKRGFVLAILSNWDSRLRHILEGMDLAPHFQEIIISSEVGAEKPHSRIFEITQNRLGLAPSEILHVGDSFYHDAQGSRNAGWGCVLVTHGAEAPTDCQHVAKLGDLLELF